jgi:hypothetical protein
MPFQPGQSGNPGGRPKENAEVKRLAREQGVASIQKLIALRDSQDERISLAACQALLDRAFGKPAQAIIGGEEDDPSIKTTTEILIRSVTASDRPPTEGS